MPKLTIKIFLYLRKATKNQDQGKKYRLKLYKTKNII